MKERLTRREALSMLSVTGAALSLIRCGETPTSPSTAEAAAATTTTGTSGTCAVSPSETVGPYPSLTDLFRSDIREGKSGAPLTLTITVVNVNNGCSLAVRRRRSLLTIRPAGLQRRVRNVSARHSDQRQRGTGDLHDDLPRVVPGTRDAHPRGRDDERQIGEGDADCISREPDGSLVLHECIRAEGSEPDDQRARQRLCRQRRVGDG